MSRTRLGIRIATVLLLAGLGAQGALAFDLQISGSITQEIGVKLSGKRNENNAAGNPFNGVAEPYRGLGSPGMGNASSGQMASPPNP